MRETWKHLNLLCYMLLKSSLLSYKYDKMEDLKKKRKCCIIIPKDEDTTASKTRIRNFRFLLET